jgi:amino acid adenylation domain-containing protein/non-ribosomal peptide synthase protein (TIGR01720 family)
VEATPIEGFRLSPQQQRLWLSQRDEAVAYAQSAIVLDGPLDRDRLRRALTSVVQWHAALHTGFQRVAGLRVPLQVMLDGEALIWRERAQLAEDSLDIKALLREERSLPVDLGCGPQVRATLLAVSMQQHVLLLSLPALCADTRTLSQLALELAHRYGDLEAAPEEPIQYPDVVEWQYELLVDEEGAEGRAYWRSDDISAVTASGLPFTNRLEAHMPYTVEAARFTLPASTMTCIEGLVQRYETSLPVFLLTCWQALLWRLSRHDDSVIGYLFDGRNYAEFQNAAGLFATCIPIHSYIAEDTCFHELLQHLRDSTSQAATWQEYFPGDPGRLAAYASALIPFGFEYIERSEPQPVAGIRFSVAEQYSAPEQFHLALLCTHVGESIIADIFYDARYVHEQIYTHIASYLKSLLQRALARPTARIGELDLLDDAHRMSLLCRSYDSSVSYRKDVCIHQLFEEQVARTPEAIAVVAGDACISFGELNALANKMARLLRRRGVGPDTQVGLYIERSIDLFVALLGVLKAGGAYVALEPGHPKPRLAMQIANMGAPLLLAQEYLLPQLPAASVPILTIEQCKELFADNACTNPSPASTSQHLAYSIYTSGSTGTPKGVAVSHRNLVNYTNCILQKLQLLSTEPETLHFATVSTFSADLGGTMIFPSLVSGGCLHIISSAVASSAAAFADYMATRPIDVLKIVPSHLNALLSADNVGHALPRKFLFLGGESFPWELLHRIEALPHTCTLFNHYGPTETTIGSLACRVDSARCSAVWSATVPIGRPLANTDVYILDSAGTLVPVGVAGELYIGGDGLARGYLQQPDLSAERFVPHPFSTEPGRRLYRTGDLVRFLPDGAIEFLGRIDQQMKIRGFRVELGEIEAALLRSPLVQAAAVIMHETASSDKQLVASIVPYRSSLPATHHERSALVDEVRRFLQDQLPDYMCPAKIVVLEQLPLTSNGKIDREALLIAVSAQADSDHRTAPRTSTEELLATIWCSILGMPEVGIHDNFFALGGHSLLMTQLLARVSTALRVDLPLRSAFDTPTIAEMAEQIEAAHQNDRELPPPLVPIPRTQPLPLSFAQQRLWFFDQLDPGSPLYAMPLVAMHLDGPLNLDALERTVDTLVQRHETLRTTFALVEGRPAQVIAAPGKAPLQFLTFAGLSPIEQASKLDQLIAAETWRSFDLAHGPLMQITLIQLGEQKHVLLLAQHHIISDGWSFRLLMREFLTCYDAFVNEQPVPLPELPIQYADYAVWQQQWLQGAPLERLLAYWRKQLDGAPALLNLPTDRHRPAEQTFHGASQPLRVPDPVFAALSQLSVQENVTFFMLMVAALQTLLYRYTGQDDIVIGTPVANRLRTETENLIGVFINTLALRTNLGGNPSFREVLKRVRETTLGAYEHQDLPFEKLVEVLQPHRALSHTPVFQVLLVFNRDHATTLDLELGNWTTERAGLTWRQQPIKTERSRFDLALINEDLIGRSWSLEYNTDLFDAAMIARMIENFQVLLGSIVADPAQPIASLALLSETERRRLLIEWNNTHSEAFTDTCIHHLIEAQARSTPERIAFVFKEQHLSYAELDARAHRLACVLQHRGVGPQIHVGIFLPRSPALLIAILAVLKSGGAYVPLDPSYPANRIEYILHDAELAVLLTSEQLKHRFLEHTIPILCVDPAEQTAEQAAITIPSSTVTADNAAYSIYTSGSTGKPKGVQICHRNVVNFFAGMDQLLGIHDDDSWLAVTSISFDISVLELLWTLARGIRVVLVDEQDVLRPAAMLAQACQQQVVLLQCTPSLMRLLLLDNNVAASLHRLRVLLVGGESLPWSLAQQVRATLPCRMLNMYGPTETTIWSSMDEIQVGEPDITIGRPIVNTTIFICDRYCELVPIGVVGEVYIGGAGVGHGYLHRPELTAERFVPDAFGTIPGARLYNTGDLARYLPDGRIEFLGRSDHQVKVRGFRIEPAEIEQVLSTHPAISAAVVVAREDPQGDARLVAYIVATPEPAPASSELRSFIKGKLPEYMQPSIFVPLQTLPLTANGKIDRRALPAPDVTQLSNDPNAVLPRTLPEWMLSNIWSDVLHVEPVGIHDNFFDLGGDSILAVQIISKANQAGLQLTPKHIFEYQTIAELALAAGTNQVMESEVGPVVGPVPLAPVQHWFLEHHGPAPQRFSSAILLEAQHAIDPALLERTLQHVLTHHDALRLHFVLEPSGWQQMSAAPDRSLPFMHVDLSAQSVAEQEATIAAAAESPSIGDLSVAPLMRVVLFDMGPEQPHRLLLVAHYLIMDRSSWAILLEDLLTIYQQLSQQVEPALLFKTTSFRQWSTQLVERARSAPMLQESSYWLALSRSWVGEFPMHYTADEQALQVAHTISDRLDKAETHELLEQAPQTDMILTVLLTALAQTCTQWIGDYPILIDVESDAREEPLDGVVLTRTIGRFTNVFPMYVDLGEASAPDAALLVVKEQLNGLPNRGVGYGLLRYLSPDASISDKLQMQTQAQMILRYCEPKPLVLPNRLFNFVREYRSPSSSPEARQPYILEIDAQIVDSQLMLDFHWTYREDLSRQGFIERFTHGTLEALHALIPQCHILTSFDDRASDFPHLALDQQSLERLIQGVDFEEA